jgi:hypothetical protein
VGAKRQAGQPITVAMSLGSVGSSTLDLRGLYPAAPFAPAADPPVPPAQPAAAPASVPVEPGGQAPPVAGGDDEDGRQAPPQAAPLPPLSAVRFASPYARRAVAAYAAASASAEPGPESSGFDIYG